MRSFDTRFFPEPEIFRKTTASFVPLRDGADDFADALDFEWVVEDRCDEPGRHSPFDGDVTQHGSAVEGLVDDAGNDFAAALIGQSLRAFSKETAIDPSRNPITCAPAPDYLPCPPFWKTMSVSFQFTCSPMDEVFK